MKSPSNASRNIQTLNSHETSMKKCRSLIYSIWVNKKLAIDNKKIKDEIFTPEHQFLGKKLTNADTQFNKKYTILASKYKGKMAANNKFLKSYEEIYHSPNPQEIKDDFVGLPPIKNIFKPIINTMFSAYRKSTSSKTLVLQKDLIEKLEESFRKTNKAYSLISEKKSKNYIKIVKSETKLKFHKLSKLNLFDKPRQTISYV